MMHAVTVPEPHVTLHFRMIRHVKRDWIRPYYKENEVKIETI